MECMCVGMFACVCIILCTKALYSFQRCMLLWAKLCSDDIITHSVYIRTYIYIYTENLKSWGGGHGLLAPTFPYTYVYG